MIDLIIILLLVAYCIWVIYSNFIKKKDNNSCSGICSSCSQCSSPFEDYYKDQKKLKEKENG